VLVVFGPVVLAAAPTTLGSIGGVAGVVALAGGWSGWSAATENQLQNWKTSVTNAVLSVAAAAFLVCLLVALSFVTSPM
jgi:hypothetical protein